MAEYIIFVSLRELFGYSPLSLSRVCTFRVLSRILCVLGFAAGRRTAVSSLFVLTHVYVSLRVAEAKFENGQRKNRPLKKELKLLQEKVKICH